MIKTKEDYIDHCTKVHSGKYDYSQIDYKRWDSMLNIICPVHGEFLQHAATHQAGKGCKACWLDKVGNNVDHFVARSKKVHGNLYDYSKSKLNKSSDEIEIICKDHGSFFQTPAVHYKGAGCPTCARIRQSKIARKTTKEFINVANEKHGNKYDYSLVDLDSSDKSVIKVKIICNNHGVFEQDLNTHLEGFGCQLCGYDAIKSNTEDFIESAKKKHGETYTYQDTKYKRSDEKLTVTCRIHGNFEQTASTHLSGKGCKKCAKTGFSPSKPATLYVLKSDNFIKVGITNRNVKPRLLEINNESPENFSVDRVFYFVDGHEAKNLESHLLETLRTSFSNPQDYFSGYTECFVTQDLYTVYKAIMEDLFS